MTLSYNGIHFPGGYEHNPNLCTNEQPTVRGVLTQRLAKVLQKKSHQKLHISTAGRTDAFVSAKSALCSFTTSAQLIEEAAAAAAATAPEYQNSSQITKQDNFPVGALCRKLNEVSQNNDITVHTILPVSSSFHATFSTKAREYVYVLPIRCHPQTAIDNTLLPCVIADKLLNSLENLPLDYFAFSSGKVKTATTICTIQQAGCWLYNTDGDCLHYASSTASSNFIDKEVTPKFGETWREVLRQDERNLCCYCLVFKLKADRFLRRMIRKLINALLQETMRIISDYNTSLLDSDVIGKEEEWKNSLILRLEQKDRSNNPPAPPIGLCLWRVEV
jgi:tRNA pseudouridine(38-40) synthase